MRKIRILTGARFGKLLVLGFAGIKTHQARWLCLCDCGNGHEVRGNHLTSGLVRSCGCLLVNRGRVTSAEVYRERLGKRFWAKVDKTPGQGPKGDCWEWIGSKSFVGGYGQFGVRPELVGLKSRQKFRAIGAHRVSYILAFGPQPEGVFVCHTCDNPPCVNPEHLWLGTCQENILDAISKGRIKWRRKINPSIVLSIQQSTLKPEVLARQFNIARETVLMVRRGSYGKPIKSHQKGRRPKFPRAIFNAIRNASGSHAEIAVCFNTTATSVGRIKRGLVEPLEDWEARIAA